MTYIIELTNGSDEAPVQCLARIKEIASFQNDRKAFPVLYFLAIPGCKSRIRDLSFDQCEHHSLIPKAHT